MGCWLLVISGARSLAPVLSSIPLRLSCRAFPCAFRRRGVSTLSAARGRTSYWLLVIGRGNPAPTC